MRDIPPGYHIRFGTRADIPALIAADRAASELFRPTGLIPDMAAIPESIPADVLSQSIDAGMMIVAADEHTAIGFALNQLYRHTLYLHQLSVDPAHGRKGVGRCVMKHVFALAEEHKRASVTLSTFRDVPWNGPFYASMGFKELPSNKLTKWMREIEAEQSQSLDITQRCFMQRPVRRSLIKRLKSNRASP